MRQHTRHISLALLSLALAVIVGASLQRDADAQTPSQVTIAADDSTIRFAPIEVWIDTNDIPLAAYQIEIMATSDNVLIVGIEGGDHPLFSEPPYYDTRALQNNRIIIADFSTAAVHELPIGRFRIVTLHVQFTGSEPPVFNTELQIAADVDGTPIAATIALIQETQS